MSDPSQNESFSLLDRVKELVAEAEVPVSLDPPTPEVIEAPLGWIGVKTLKWRKVDGFGVRDGYELSARPRTEADGDAEYVVVQTTPPPRTYDDGSPMPPEEKAEWPSWGESGLIDPKVKARFDRPQRGWSLNRNSGVIR